MCWCYISCAIGVAALRQHLKQKHVSWVLRKEKNTLTGSLYFCVAETLSAPDLLFVLQINPIFFQLKRPYFMLGSTSERKRSWRLKLLLQFLTDELCPTPGISRYPSSDLQPLYLALCLLPSTKEIFSFSFRLNQVVVTSTCLEGDKQSGSVLVSALFVTSQRAWLWSYAFKDILDFKV